ncbi:MAG TPA: hypothetical protein VN256_00295 [Pyrinomonadaceae bacterium]|nr:hypothetical protein [Pyrinomonadaceae bacterium]
MKAALTLILLAALAAVCAARAFAEGESAPDVSVLSFEWKYAGYDRAETVRDNESSASDDPSTTYKVTRGTLYVFKYTAKASVKNTGAKAIKAVSWDYVFTDEKERKELKRYRLQSKQQILPGETQTLTAGIGLDPKDKSRHITTGKQSVEIAKLEYADGSVWKKD